MADDRAEIIGKWSVKFRHWVWEYEFFGDGSVKWRDPLNIANGEGRWVKTFNLINLTWYGSNTKESWRCPIVRPQASVWYDAPYGIGPATATKLPDAPPKPSAIPVSPDIANVPWERYLDQFLEPEADGKNGPIYDMNYKVPADRSFAYSSIFRLTYGDGVTIEFDFEKELSTQHLNSVQARDAMAQGHIGQGNWIYPKTVAPETCPRLWSLREDAIRMQNDDANLFIAVAMAGVSFILSVSPMPAGAPISSPGKVGRQRVPGVTTGRAGARLANAMRKAGKPVVVNMGGTGEVAEAINLNPNKVAPRKDIPNLIERMGEEIAEVFEAGSVDRITSNRLPPNTLDWRRVIPGAYKVLKPGGKMTIRFQAVGQDAAIIEEELAKAGFKNVTQKNTYGSAYDLLK